MDFLQGFRWPLNPSASPSKPTTQRNLKNRTQRFFRCPGNRSEGKKSAATVNRRVVRLPRNAEAQAVRLLLGLDQAPPPAAARNSSRTPASVASSPVPCGTSRHRLLLRFTGRVLGSSGVGTPDPGGFKFGCITLNSGLENDRSQCF